MSWKCFFRGCKYVNVKTIDVDIQRLKFNSKGFATLERCSCCGKERAFLLSAEGREELDIEYFKLKHRL